MRIPLWLRVLRALKEILKESPDSIPAWFLDWYYTLTVARRAVWQMLSIALLSPAAGLKQTYGLMRATMSYLTLFWQAHVAATGLRLGGFGAPVWKWLSAADMAKGIAG